MIALPSCDAAISCVRWQLLPTEKFHFRCCTFRIKNNPRLHFQRNIGVDYGVLCESNSSFEVHTVTLATLTYKENFFFRSKKKPLLLLAFKCLHKHLAVIMYGNYVPTENEGDDTETASGSFNLRSLVQSTKGVSIVFLVTMNEPR